MAAVFQGMVATPGTETRMLDTTSANFASTRFTSLCCAAIMADRTSLGLIRGHAHQPATASPRPSAGLSSSAHQRPNIIVGLVPDRIAIDGWYTKAPGGEVSGRSRSPAVNGA